MAFTDSGGIQKETAVLGVPGASMHENRERPVTCTVCTNVPAGTDFECIRKAICLVGKGNPTPNRISYKWDGHVAKRIVARFPDEHSVSC